MKLRDTVLEEVGRLPASKLSIVHQIVALIKQDQPIVCGKKSRSRAHVKAQRILSKCRISLSGDIVAAREDRV